MAIAVSHCVEFSVRILVGEGGSLNVLCATVNKSNEFLS